MPSGLLLDLMDAWTSGVAQPDTDTTPSSSDAMRARLETIEQHRLSLRDSGELAQRLNTTQARVYRANLDAQVRFQDNLQNQHQAAQDLNWTRQNDVATLAKDIQDVILSRKVDVAEIEGNTNAALVSKIRDAASAETGWAALLQDPFYGDDAPGMRDPILYATLSAAAANNPTFLDWEEFEAGNFNEALAGAGLDPTMSASAIRRLESAHSVYSRLQTVNAELETAETTANAISASPGNVTSAMRQDLMNSLNQLMRLPDPSTGLTGHFARAEYDAERSSFEILEEHAAFREMLNTLDVDGQQRINRGMSRLVGNEEFQQWAADHGYRVGVVRDGHYWPGRQDDWAAMIWRMERQRRETHGYETGSTGHFIEIPLAEGQYSVGGKLMTRAELDQAYNVSEQEDGTLSLTLRGADPAITGPQPLTATPTQVVERSRVNAWRMIDQPGMTEYFDPVTQEVKYISTNSIIRTVDDYRQDPTVTTEQAATEDFGRRFPWFQNLRNQGAIPDVGADVLEVVADPAGTGTRDGFFAQMWRFITPRREGITPEAAEVPEVPEVSEDTPAEEPEADLGTTEVFRETVGNTTITSYRDGSIEFRTPGEDTQRFEADSQQAADYRQMRGVIGKGPTKGAWARKTAWREVLQDVQPGRDPRAHFPGVETFVGKWEVGDTTHDVTYTVHSDGSIRYTNPETGADAVATPGTGAHDALMAERRQVTRSRSSRPWALTPQQELRAALGELQSGREAISGLELPEQQGEVTPPISPVDAASELDVDEAERRRRAVLDLVGSKLTSSNVEPTPEPSPQEIRREGRRDRREGQREIRRDRREGRRAYGRKHMRTIPRGEEWRQPVVLPPPEPSPAETNKPTPESPPEGETAAEKKRRLEARTSPTQRLVNDLL